MPKPKQITAWAIIKKSKNKISALDIFAHNDIEIDKKTELLIKVVISPYEKNIKTPKKKTHTK